ncbi:hypothetical protein PHYBLDRAFT_60448 [Phycomyces blakesleeanus NRRL 1555(-)]|uniref:Uncharacterized protein n=1 Tax=Phycomyces blakesleeanus (strain ATCC 8743b / DSM 1359 / FGSC 10004 / NBRC 33097 / NRRL 1555) TaxID=763407 RepID=A0A167P638_PHYB8|nr:hypothetical protein PHYBLDRAFT_60448 [Phycomyces blakesleeanus NRRL 1555(-)]OAD77319.1 hypothetical protein PHYBLDRAFT_60448 [Phycomyces blakesleeanus NRRL 1555(-)]|eukprot:XP_018295359.1 hypothetical protein PHYBLDRAFT_60448 [Phycomyces blakesleeanus NRRL 1555(-)]
MSWLLSLQERVIWKTEARSGSAARQHTPFQTNRCSQNNTFRTTLRIYTTNSSGHLRRKLPVRYANKDRKAQYKRSFVHSLLGKFKQRCTLAYTFRANGCFLDQRFPHRIAHNHNQLVWTLAQEAASIYAAKTDGDILRDTLKVEIEDKQREMQREMQRERYTERWRVSVHFPSKEIYEFFDITLTSNGNSTD